MILVTKYAQGGGAERIASQLHAASAAAAIDRGSRWRARPGAPGDADDPTILAIPNPRPPLNIASRGAAPGITRARAE